MSEIPDESAPPDIPPLYVPSFALLLLVIAIVAGIVFYSYGTLSPCNIFRMKARQMYQREGYITSALVGAMPDRLLDLTLKMQYGELRPGRCFALLFAGHWETQPLKTQPAGVPQELEPPPSGIPQPEIPAEETATPQASPPQNQ